jgi:hypothetical protein
MECIHLSAMDTDTATTVYGHGYGYYETETKKHQPRVENHPSG